MNYSREIKVGVLAAVCLFLLFFGFNFLKGVNIFSPTNSFHGTFTDLHGLEEQAQVIIRGHKVGQVDRISYDFTRDSAFTVDISIKRDIVLPQGTQMALIADGLLGGMAIELQLPSTSGNGLTAERSNSENGLFGEAGLIAKGSFLPTTYVPGLMESVQGELLAKIGAAVEDVDSLVAELHGQLEGDHLQSALTNVDRISGDLTTVSHDLKRLMNNQVPRIVNNADTAVANLNTVLADIKEADLKSTVARVDKAVENVNGLVSDVRSPNGTIGQLIYSKSLYDHVDATVISADSLLVDLKAHPKRYVHFSIFGKKDK
ncbi:MAG: MCE family protein [Paludibacteraceae bacterium]|nr:MCE family protein [Paludibacteraceae bacterium]